MHSPNTSTTKPINHRKLNDQQIEILLALYKFRFATPELISKYQEQLVRYSNARLKILLEQEYIGRNYDSSYRIKHRPATYYLLPKGVRFLKSTQELDPKGLHLSYHSHKASPEFITHWLRMFRIYLKLDELYGESLELYTSTEVAEQGDYPKPRPDAFLQFSDTYNAMPDCMIDLIESNKSSDQIRFNATRYIKHYENEDSWGERYPCILLVCDNLGLEREVQRTVARTLNARGLTKPSYYTTTLRALYGSPKTDTPIWIDVAEPGERVSLTGLQ